MRILIALAFALGLTFQLSFASCATVPETGTNCKLRPSCMKYLKTIRKRVYREWMPASHVQSGTVTVSFRVDLQGHFTDIRVLRSDSEDLAASCKQAMRDATKIPPVPEALSFLVQKELRATFAFERPSP
jgi:TonB family protein